MNNLFTDTTMWALEHALDAVAERQRVVSNNIANAVTPGCQSPSARCQRSSWARSFGRTSQSRNHEGAL